MERAVGGLGDAEVVHLAADLLVRVVGVQVRIEVLLERVEERGRVPRGVEVVDGLGLIGERRRLDERHLLPAPEAAAFVPLAEEQVLLGVRLAAVGVGGGPHPEVALRCRGNAHEVEDEARAFVHEATAHRRVAIVGVGRLDAEALQHLPRRERGEIDGRGRRLRAREEAERRGESKGSDAHDAVPSPMRVARPGLASVRC